MSGERLTRLAEQARHFTADTKYKLQQIKPYMRQRGRESILVDIPIEYPDGFDEITSHYLQTGEYFPIVLGSHKAHPAGIPTARIALHIRDIAFKNGNTPALRGAMLLVAGNIAEGQNNTISDTYAEVRPILDKLSTRTLPVLRWKDMRNMDKAELEKHLRRQKEELDWGIAHGLIPVSLPEGSVESGRFKKDGEPGEINGMIPLQRKSVRYLTDAVREAGYEPLLFFVGNTGENRIYDPNTQMVTAEAYRRAKLRAIPGGKLFVPSLMQSRVDYPIPLHEIEEVYGDKNGKLPDGTLELFSGECIASELPEDERGAYTELKLTPPTIIYSGTAIE